MATFGNHDDKDVVKLRVHFQRIEQNLSVIFECQQEEKKTPHYVFVVAKHNHDHVVSQMPLLILQQKNEHLQNATSSYQLSSHQTLLIPDAPRQKRGDVKHDLKAANGCEERLRARRAVLHVQPARILVPA